MIQRYPITIKKTQMIRILKLRKEFCLTVKVKHRQLHLLKTNLTFTDLIISSQTTLRESWIQKLQSSWIQDQNAITSQIFLPALCQMNWKWWLT